MIMILTANDTHSHEELFRFELEFDLKTFGQNTFCIIGTSLAHPRNAMMHGVLPWNALVHICEWTENPCGFVRSVDESSSKSAISPPIFVDSDSGESSMTYACKFQRQESGQKKHNFLVVRLWKTEPHLHHCAVQRHFYDRSWTLPKTSELDTHHGSGERYRVVHLRIIGAPKHTGLEKPILSSATAS